MSDKYTIHNEVGLHFVTFTVVDWVAGPETVIWLVNPSHLPAQTPTKAKVVCLTTSMAKKRAGSNAHFVHQEPGFILCIKLDCTLSARMFS
jgi:hypothetical protein